MPQRLHQPQHAVLADRGTEQHRTDQSFAQFAREIVEHRVARRRNILEQLLHQRVVVIGELFQHREPGFLLTVEIAAFQGYDFGGFMLAIDEGAFQRQIDEACDLIAGFVDLALERAFVYREHKASEVVALEGGDLDREKEARFSMLEKLADHDDALMEQLLEDIPPPRDAVFDDLARELREGLICPVLLGSATRENGVLRLMKALRHESPGVTETAKRLGASSPKDALAYVFKTIHLQHGGKLSLTRLLAGHLDDGTTLQSSSGEAGRASGISSPNCAHDTKRASAEAGDTVALGKLDAIKTGDTLSSGKVAPPALANVGPLPPVLAIAISAADRKDDVKLGQALLRLNEEDPSLTMVQNPQTHDIVLWGQGEMHLRVALERLRERFGVNVKSQPPAIGYQRSEERRVGKECRSRWSPYH